jgi:class 3 adenylate cyclase
LAEELIKVSQLNVNSNFEGLEAVSQSMTSYALGINATWPFVTHPNFGAISQTVLENIRARFVAWVPFVQPEERAEWEAYSVANQGFVEDLKKYFGFNYTTFPIVPFIFRIGNDTVPVVYDTEPLDPELPFHAPVWQLVPPLEGPQFVNFQAWQDPYITRTIQTLVRRRESVMSEPFTSFTYDSATDNPWPEAYYMSPVFDSFDENANQVGYVDTFGDLRLFDNILSDQGLDGIIAVVSNPCSETYTWQINGPESEFIGAGELVEPDFRKYGIVESATALRTSPECPVTISIYPSEQFEDEFHTADPAIFTAATVLIFVLTALFFVVYDWMVEKRQGKVLNTAQQSGAIVDSLFPAHIRERLMENQENKSKLPGGQESKKKRLGLDVFESKPIADYYPEATVIVADIANFSAWSSVREPSQVFSLLETLYNSFDLVAKKRRIFKVESMADCYVACCNVPDPRKDHAVAVCRFAKDCRRKMNEVVQKLEVWLGPDTSDLRMRFAINTGPVTAGVLRGEKARFQLFGTTMDLCFRLEASGEIDEIHVAETTAVLVKAAGLESWLTPRKDKVVLKGRGETQTYWLDYGTAQQSVRSGDVDATAENSSQGSSTRADKALARQSERLIDWNVDVLSRLLKEIIAMRTTAASKRKRTAQGLHLTRQADADHTVLDEVQDIINVKTDDAPKYHVDPSTLELDPNVVSQLKSYVATVSSLYQPNPFHNFEHACHVTQAVTKMLSRVVTQTKIDVNTMSYKQDKEAQELHKFTYGITSDPLIQFSCALSALIQ